MSDNCKYLWGSFCFYAKAYFLLSLFSSTDYFPLMFLDAFKNANLCYNFYNEMMIFH